MSEIEEKPALDKLFRFSHGHRVRYEEVDAQGIVGNASWLSLLQLGRIEYLRDRGEQKVFTTDSTDPSLSINPDKVLAMTATAQYDLWKNVISRVEFRWDHSLSGQRVWGTPRTDGEGGVISGSLRNEWLLAANLIYKF